MKCVWASHMKVWTCHSLVHITDGDGNPDYLFLKSSPSSIEKKKKSERKKEKRWSKGSEYQAILRVPRQYNNKPPVMVLSLDNMDEH